MTLGHRPHAVTAHGPGIKPRVRSLPEEVAVALSLNGSTRAVMMATPADLVDFAYGFCLTEGIAARDEIETVTPVETGLGIDLQIWLQPGAEAREASRRRTMAGPVGCGLCGLDSLEAAQRQAPVVCERAFTMTPDQVMAAAAALRGHQPLHDITHAVHAAAFWAGGIRAAREDVGRHNALDKLIGALHPFPPGALVLTCRPSIDMVQKAAAADLPILIAASAPTAAAVALAEATGITLIGLARADGFEIFTNPRRILAPKAAHVA